MSHSVAGSLPPLAGRLVPFAACSAANCLNIPLMRRQELGAGTTVETSQGEALGSSRVAAREAIARVTLSRIGSGPLHYLHSIYTLYKQYLHYLHSICTVSTQYLHSIYTVSTHIYTGPR